MCQGASRVGGQRGCLGGLRGRRSDNLMRRLTASCGPADRLDAGLETLADDCPLEPVGHPSLRSRHMGQPRASTPIRKRMGANERAPRSLGSQGALVAGVLHPAIHWRDRRRETKPTARWLHSLALSRRSRRTGQPRPGREQTSPFPGGDQTRRNEAHGRTLPASRCGSPIPATNTRLGLRETP